jgi:hypothetical protein
MLRRLPIGDTAECQSALRPGGRKRLTQAGGKEQNSGMTITPSLFGAFLKCPTKCWLRFTGEPPSGNPYAAWVQAEHESYRADAAKRLTADASSSCRSRGDEAQISAESLKTAQWQLAVDVDLVVAQASPPASSGSVPLPGEKPGGTPGQLADGTSALQSRLHALERIPSEGRGKAAQFIPIRFVFTNKLGRDDKLLLAFDALVLSHVLGREISLGKIIHGDDYATLKVKIGARTAESARPPASSKGLASEVRKRLDKITALLANPTPPDLVLNRHCAECEFQPRRHLNRTLLILPQ